MPQTVDTSIYQPANIPSALDTLGKLTGIQNTTNQNKLFQQQYNSNLGISQIYKSAVDPQTGQLDPNKLNQLLADPTASANVTLGLPQAIQQSQAAQQQQLQIQSQQLALKQQHYQNLLNYVNPIASNPHATSSDVAGAIGHAVANGLVDPTTAAQFWSAVPRDQQGNIMEQAIPQWAQHIKMQALSAVEQLNATNPAPTAINTGGQTNLVTLPQVGSPQQVGSMQNTLPPTTTTMQGNQPVYVGGVNGSTQSGAGGPGTVPAGPALGASSAADVAGSASANQGIELQRSADQVPAQKALLGNLEGALNAFGSGPGAQWKQVAKSFVNTNNPFGNVFDAKSIASQEEFNKQATQLAQAQFQTLGGTGTDAKLDSAMHTSPNEALTPLGNKGIIAMLKGNADAISSKNQAWQNWQQSGHGPESYGQFSSQFNKSYDPRVFQSQYLSPEDNKKMLSGMTKTEQKSFLNSYRTSLNNGWIQLPGAQQNAGQ